MDNATMGCNLLLQLIKLEPNLNNMPIIDLILSSSIAQSKLTRCVIHNDPTINLIVTINIVW
jgi:hypothetical protein